MGRKPNALILHYFHRGAKLEDASNRYQHTCKACGEVFPKGRIDSLQNHLTKKCPALSVQERTQVVLQIHNVPGAVTTSKAEKKIKEPKSSSRLGHVQTPQQTFEGLNVLAEASRQVGQVERRGSQTYPPTTSAGDDPMNLSLDHAIDPSLDAVFPTHFPNTFDELGSFSQANGPSSNSAIASLPPFPPFPSDNAEDDHSQIHPVTDGPTESPDISMHSQPEKDLSTIAADANELLPDQRDQSGSAEQDGGDTAEATPVVMDGNGAVQSGRPTNDENTVDSTGPAQNGERGDGNIHSDQWQINFDGPNYQAFYEEMQKATEGSEPPSQQPTSTTRPIAVRGRSQPGEFSEFRVRTSQPKQTTRQRFTADRRKEVQDVRKKGACLRCRMLRKPCSSETPCGTCRSVDTARIWKEPCMRVRLPDLFDLFIAGLHASLAYRDINLVKSQLQFEHLHGQIQATHFEDATTGISFKTLQGQIDPAATGVQLLASENVSLGAQEVKLIDGEGDDLVVKISDYLQTYGPSLQENEPSHFMRSSLAAASDLYEESKDALLGQTMELWTATHVLCDLEMQWKIYYSSVVTQETSVIDQESDPLSYALITSQIRALIEKRAAQLSKKILQGLERKLMHNHRGFDIFLISVILLNCVERTTWLFRTWENETYAARWPLERRPEEYWDQAEHFSEILHIVLKMRTVPPKISPRPDDGLLIPMDSVNEEVVAWYGAIQLTVEHLKQYQDASFNASDSRSFDLKYAARILLPPVPTS